MGDAGAGGFSLAFHKMTHLLEKLVHFDTDQTIA